MVLEPWLRRIQAKLSPSKRFINNYFLDERAFRFEAARERVRADRSGSPLSILFIELPVDRASRRDFVFLSRVLRRRLRITDTTGVLGDCQVGVLLPDTPKAGAWKVASDICDAYPVGHDRPDCEVCVYPDEAPTPIDPQRQNGEQPVGGATAQFESLFVYPTPFVKRAIDVLGASVGLLIAVPLIAILAVLIKATSRGPVIFTQEREGLGGRRFRICKLRTMGHGAHNHQWVLRPFSHQDGPAFKMVHDPRTTWIGRLLRRSSLDELPQLWNVLKGEMSLVGPRPLPVDESQQCLPWQRQRLSVVPGMTCVWQVHGRNTVSFNEWMRMDIGYLRRRSLAYDLNLIVRTAPALVLQRGPR